MNFCYEILQIEDQIATNLKVQELNCYIQKFTDDKKN